MSLMETDPLPGYCHTSLCLPAYFSFVFLLVSLLRSVCLAVWLSVCVSDGLLSTSMCLHTYLSVSIFVTVNAEHCECIRLPRFGACPGETLARLIRSLAHVKLIAFHRLSFDSDIDEWL